MANVEPGCSRLAIQAKSLLRAMQDATHGAVLATPEDRLPCAVDSLQRGRADTFTAWLPDAGVQALNLRLASTAAGARWRPHYIALHPPAAATHAATAYFMCNDWLQVHSSLT
jgi:hypothetical protein